MPPHVSRKRQATIDAASPPKRARLVKTKSNVFAAVDANNGKTATPEQTRAYLEALDNSDDSDTGKDSDGDDVFEDVPGIALDGKGGNDEDDMDWEDAIGTSMKTGAGDPGDDPDIADVTISLDVDGKYATVADRAASTLKKGPSKREREVRNGTHCIHVQSLMWHNAIRNAWLNDNGLQAILLDTLPEGIHMEIEKWRHDIGMPKEGRLRAGAKQLKKGKATRKSKKDKRGGRDWDLDAERQEDGVVNMSRGDPTLRLLKILTAYWRKRFTVTAPGLRKLGYMPLKRLTQEINSWKKDKDDYVRHGERVGNMDEFKALARSCEGSRDVGSQLFTALLRGLGLEARMVANLQPAGIGWGKSEEAKPLRESSNPSEQVDVNEATDSEARKDVTKKPSKSARPTKKSLTPRQNGVVSSTANNAAKSSRKSTRTSSVPVISLDTDDESSLSSVPSDIGDDDASVVDITEISKKQRTNRKYDRDLHYPNYWTEVVSPITNSVVPVDPIVLSTVATNGELLATFEPRGKRADQAKQVICYTVAHATDGSAKDVTVRYLKKHQLPGRTKGFRMPVDKIKVYDRKGKVKKYEEYDWFRTVMSVFERPHHLRTAADDLEEATDLKPFKPENAKPAAEVESLQWYKQSADFVLERHLRREEAIPPWAKPVKTFKIGKGDKSEEVPVYRRSDILLCKTAESWHKEGREIRIGEQPMKLVPMRAVTTTRKREMEEVERETGEKAKQGLFSRDQTDWIIPPPIGEDREIPRNAFGNIDVYVPSMVPKGAVHIALKGTARICRDLDISYAEAVTGFEFGKRMAIPIITGVVVAQENEKRVKLLWREREAEKKRKEDDKRTQLCLALWRKFFSGLRIVERMKREYADTGREEDINPFVRKSVPSKSKPRDTDGNEAMRASAVDMSGGFLRDGEEDASAHDDIEDDLDAEDPDVGGGFIVEDVEGTKGTKASDTAPITPMSMQSAYGDAKANLEKNEVDTVEEPSDEPAQGNKSRKRRSRKVAERNESDGAGDGEAMEDSNGVTEGDDDDDDDGESDDYAPPSKTRKTAATARGDGRKRKSPTKSRYFARGSRRRSARGQPG